MTLQPYTPQPLQTVPILEDGQVKIWAVPQREYEAFRDALPTWRHQLICMVLRNTGLRVTEIVGHHDPKTGMVVGGLEGRHCRLNGPDYYILVKRRKQRKTDPDYVRMYLHPNLGVQLRNYMQGNDIQEADRVFPVTSRAVQLAFAKTSLKVLGYRFHPHMLRHSFGNILRKGGASVEVTSEMMGHADIKTTIQHYQHLDDDERRFIGERIKP